MTKAFVDPFAPPRTGTGSARYHFLIQLGTGLRSGELLGLRRRRVFPELGRIEVIEVRSQAGRFGRGFKAEPKSLASVRVVPMCDRVREAIARQLADGARPEDLVLPRPGAFLVAVDQLRSAVSRVFGRT